MKNANFSIKPMTRYYHISLNRWFIVVLYGIICVSVRFCDNSLLLLKMRFQVFRFASKSVQGFSSDRKMLMLLLSVLFHLPNRVSVFWNFSPRYLEKSSLYPWNPPHFLRNSDKSLLSLLKASAFLQIFFPKNLLFRQVLRASVFLNSKCLKASNNGTHVPSFINEFVALIRLSLWWLVGFYAGACGLGVACSEWWIVAAWSVGEINSYGEFIVCLAVWLR